jgi:2-dehydro-3-deoxyphosphogluconate aldolase/(4S)-4-hydroxy-2-oxoglutarate aldolase
MDSVLRRMGEVGLVPVIRLESERTAVDLGRTLIRGGIPVAEVTFRSAAAPSAIRAMAAEVPDLLVGAGTVLTVAQAEQALAAGARFIVSPCYPEPVVDFCLGQGIPVLPAVNHPDGVARGLAQGLEALKFFPAGASGGLGMLDALAGPFGAMRFVPTGGINAANLGEYARRPQVLAVGGSWMVPPALVDAGDWPAVERLCRDAVQALHGFSFAHLGINAGDEETCRSVAGALTGLFGLPAREGNSSIFAGDRIEVTRRPGPGERGHIAIRCNQVERAVAHFAAAGVTARRDTARSAKGRCTSIYLDLEIGGFALHLLQA